jgi:hypothetical protein
LAREQIGSPAVLVMGRVLDWAVVGQELGRGQRSGMKVSNDQRCYPRH